MSDRGTTPVADKASKRRSRGVWQTSKVSAGDVSGSRILTPDRRLRVFISSTLGELREEREAARDAIEAMRLTPVMFEAGARSHPPRDLYRAYLAQSDVFVGIYGEKYGWIAPGMDRSGLEDEYRLSGGHPRLIYIKNSRHREPRLTSLIDEIADAGVAYRHFEDGDQLRRLLADDLAVLLSESFILSDAGPNGETRRSVLHGLPTPANAFIGRDYEIEAIVGLISDPDVRLVTIGGPGGVGKSRLALELATRLADRYENTTLTLLEGVSQPEGVVPAILANMGLSESALPPLEAVRMAVSDRRWLFVMDNFEHVLGAAVHIGELLELVPTCNVIATSRASLGVRAEHLFTLDPLAVPEEGATAQEILATPSVELFLTRAEAAGSTLTPASDVESLARLARLLEGMPLSLELAAGRTRMLSLAQILDRLEQSFEFLRSSAPDLPQRHHSIETTIKWSFDLLTERERQLGGSLSVFEGGFTVEHAEGLFGADVLDGLSSLIAKNLVRVDTSRGEPRLSMLRPIRAYAAHEIEDAGLTTEIRASHARYFLNFADSAAQELRGPGQVEWLHRLSQDDENVFAAISHAALELGSDLAASSLWNVYPYLEYMGQWREANNLGDLILSGEPSEFHRGRTLAVLGLMSFWLGDLEAAYRQADQAIQALGATGDRVGLAYALGLRGVLGMMGHDVGEAGKIVEKAVTILEGCGDLYGAGSILTGVGWMGIWLGLPLDSDVTQRAIDVSRKSGSTTELAISLCNRGLQLWREGRPDRARILLSEGLQTARDTTSIGLETLALASLVEMVAHSPSPATAVTLASAIETARTRPGGGAMSLRWSGHPLPSPVVAQLEAVLAVLRDELDPSHFQDAWKVGRTTTLANATEQAFRALDNQD